MTLKKTNTEQPDFDRDLILAAFLVEAGEGLDVMEQSLMALEENTADVELLNDVFRVAHTIKGNAAALDLNELAQFAHKLEDLLDKLRQHEIEITHKVIDLLLKAVDELRVMVPAAASSDQITPAQQELRKKIA